MKEIPILGLKPKLHMTSSGLLHHYINESNSYNLGAITNHRPGAEGTRFDPVVGVKITGDAIAPYLDSLFRSFPDAHYELTSMAEKNTTVVFEWLMSGLNLEDNPATYKTIKLSGIDVIDIEDAKISSIRIYFDRQSYTGQFELIVE